MSLRYLFVFSVLVASAAVVRFAGAQTVPEGFVVETVHEEPGDLAVGFAFLPDERILVITHQSGAIHLIADGVLKDKPIATIPDLAVSSERGLLGIAVDPDYPEANHLYLYYTSNSGTNRVSKFDLDGALSDPVSHDLTLDLDSEQILLEIADGSQYHNAGTLRFGSDKTLYISHGDDVSHVPTREPYLQDLTNLYGKILRINRDGTVPADNPTFPSSPDAARPEIFAIGLRNPFRFGIDPLTDRLFIGDVGTNLREEFNLSTGGENFGYPKHEGSGFFREDSPIIAPEPTPPIYDYPNGGQGSAIGLATYRQKNFPDDYSFPGEYDGVHFFAEYFDDALNYLRPALGGTWEMVAFGTGFGRSVDASVAADGSLYVLSYDGALRRIYYDNPTVSSEEPPVAADFELLPNYPNPFVEKTVVSYRIASPAVVRLEVFDVLGRRVTTLVDAYQTPGTYSAGFSAPHLPAGAYLVRLDAGGRTTVSTMVKR